MVSNKILEQINKDTLDEFELLSKIYRPSFYTRKIADYLKKRVQELRPGIEVWEDQYRASLIDDTFDAPTSSGNIWFDIPANDPKLEDNEPIILQAHMDMVVASTNKKAEEEIRKNGVTFQINSNGNLISKKGQTSLGADDGIGIGLMLAILKNKEFKHGPIRFLITADEEVGMCGASYLGLTKTGEKGAPLLGYKYLINLDNPYHGQIIVSTAGAVVTLFTLPKNPDTEPLSKNVNTFKLDVSGLLGGHDGININNQASALKIVAEVFEKISDDSEFRLVDFSTPDCDYHNVIQTHAVATFATKHSLDEIKKVASSCEKACKDKYPHETGVKIEVNLEKLPADVEIKPLPHQDSVNVIKLMNSLPFGPISWKNKSTGWIETSGNIGPVVLELHKREENGKKIWDCPAFYLRAHIRSCNNEHLLQAVEDNRALSKKVFGYDDLDYFQLKNILYGWPGDSNTTLLDLAKKAYESMDIKWKTLNIHGGLEISWFKYFNPDLSMVSIGPEVHDVHLCSETLFIETLPGFINSVLYCVDGIDKVKK